ncbi:hypothetical protein, partial [Escherichia coli]|uniref:hypothetical protein n=1 Tax=Escherichia coli TaxID=562 RepID=UPI003B773718
PHGWHLSNAGFAVSPLPPPGMELRSLIDERRVRMSPAERSLLENALSNPRWRERFAAEREVELARMAGHRQRLRPHQMFISMPSLWRGAEHP